LMKMRSLVGLQGAENSRPSDRAKQYELGLRARLHPNFDGRGRSRQMVVLQGSRRCSGRTRIAKGINDRDSDKRDFHVKGICTSFGCFCQWAPHAV
jgi:hypothetical protein